VQVEDHPLEYGGFEGIIPKGQYGGGTVMLWDRGTFENLGGEAAKDLEEGKLHIALDGKKLHGEWTLVRMRRGDGNEWLIIKSGEDLKPISKKRDDESSLTGRTMAEIAREQDAKWQSNRTENSAPKRLLRSAKAAPALKFIPPMKAVLVDAAPSHGQWDYELKFDGYRALALKNGSEVQIVSRNEKDFTARFPEITEAVAQLSAERIALDGEIVALQPNGIPSFQLLQGIEMRSRPPLAFYIFDLLCEGKEDLTREPLHVRRERLQKVLADAEDPIRFSATIQGEPKKLLEEVRRRGLEGLIGKERESLYEAGRRSPSWIKLKCVQEQEFVIGGYTPPEGTRKHFGALLVGVYDQKKLKFSGKVGTGFNAAMLQRLYRQMRALAQKDCPFSNLPERTQGRWLQNITPREMSQCHWIEPRLVCQIRFTEWTDEGKLRHPAFIGLREDKAAEEVVREKSTAPPE
jgi:bifunctional non-homologous end joining protein LigD